MENCELGAFRTSDSGEKVRDRSASGAVLDGDHNRVSATEGKEYTSAYQRAGSAVSSVISYKPERNL
jgi:hypothetical protein